MAGAILGLALSAASFAPAFAAPVSLTWNPSAALATTPDGSFTFNNITTADYGAVTLGAFNGTTTSFTETGILNRAAFTNNASLTSGVNLGRAGPAGYVEYVTFTATGTLAGNVMSFNVPPATTFGGLINTVDYKLFIVQSGGTAPSFGANSAGATGPTPIVGAPIDLAHGSLIGGPGTVTLSNSSNGLSAGANFTASFITDTSGAASNFFVNPAAGIGYLGINLFSSSTNTGSVLSVDPTGKILIIGGGINGGGGGNVTFSAPEPTSLALLGVGLSGLGFLARAKQRKRNSSVAN